MTVATKNRATTTKLDTRAVYRIIEAGVHARCSHCQKALLYKISRKSFGELLAVLCNVYKGPKSRRLWSSLEWYHYPCYIEAGKPHGEISYDEVSERRRSQIEADLKTLS